MARVRLLLDEDVRPGLAVALQNVGYDALSVHDIGRCGLSDEAQLAWAVSQGRTIFTHNIRDFVSLAQIYAEEGLVHMGIIVAVKFDKGTLIERTLALLSSLDEEALKNVLRFV